MTPDRLIGWRTWAGLAVSSMSFVLILDGLAIAVAFGEIEEAFPTTARTTLAWITTGYTISIASLMLVAGQLADRIGWRRTFIIGISLFAVGGLIAAAAPNVEVLIAARVFQGCAAALFTVTAFPLALLEFPPTKRGKAMGWIGVGGATAGLIAPVLGASLITATNWRSGFLLPTPLCIVAAVLAPHVLPERTGERRPIDTLGILIAAGAVATVTLSILQRWLILTPVPVILAWLFIVRMRRHPHPLVRPDLFADRRYRWATISQLATQMAIFAWFFSMPLFLTNVWGWSTLASGGAMAVPMLLSFNSVLAGNYADRHGYRPVLTVGGLITAAGLFWWAATIGESESWPVLLIGMSLFGWGAGMVGVTGMGAALNSAHDTVLAEANAALQTGRRLIQGLGAAVALTVLGDRDVTSVTNFRWVWVIAGSGYALSAIVLVFYPRERRFAALRD
jgi:MFS family permease